MSCGFKVSIPLFDIKGIPSTTYNGVLLALSERTPRILIVPISPGRSLLVISTPAALPCIASKALATGREVKSSELTLIIAPVTSDFFCTPYPTTTTSSKASLSSLKITFTAVLPFKAISCVLYPI